MAENSMALCGLQVPAPCEQKRRMGLRGIGAARRLGLKQVNRDHAYSISHDIRVI